MNNSIFVYTAITGGRDLHRTDIPVFCSSMFSEPAYNARIYKLLPHLFFPEYSIYLWIDGNLCLNKPFDYYKIYLGDSDIGIFKHPDRSNIYEEADAIKKLKKLKDPIFIKNLDEQITYYKNQGFDDNILYETGFIVRRNSPQINIMCESWWSHLCRWQYRDQVSLPFILKQHSNIKVNTIEGRMDFSKDLIYKPHVK